MPVSALTSLTFLAERHRIYEQMYQNLDPNWQDKKSQIFRWRDDVWYAHNPQFCHVSPALTAGSAPTMRLPLNVGQLFTIDEIFEVCREFYDATLVTYHIIRSTGSYNPTATGHTRR